MLTSTFKNEHGNSQDIDAESLKCKVQKPVDDRSLV